METAHPLVYLYQDLILGFEPTSHVRMGPRGAAHKYVKVYRPLTLRIIQSHLRGDITVAACLINKEGMARAAVLDIDVGYPPHS